MKKLFAVKVSYKNTNNICNSLRVKTIPIRPLAVAVALAQSALSDSFSMGVSHIGSINGQWPSQIRLFLIAFLSTPLKFEKLQHTRST